MNSTTSSVAAAAVPMGRVDAAIRQAATRSGVDFSYLYNQARLESSLDPNARKAQEMKAIDRVRNAFRPRRR